MRTWVVVFAVALLAGCGGAAKHDDRTADAVRLAELQLLATSAPDRLVCAKYKAVADDFKRISSVRVRYALLNYYDCLEQSASRRKRRSDEIGEATQNGTVKAESARVSAAALRDATDYARQAGLLHIPIVL